MSTTAVRDRLEIAPEVVDALAAGRPVVALESTLISHGLDYPYNLEVATASEAGVRESGADKTAEPGTPAPQVTGKTVEGEVKGKTETKA
jgi:pseudouridine-5'-phosphate glycosidase